MSKEERDALIEKCAFACDCLGDAEFERLARKGNTGIATLAQRHYRNCADTIRAMKLKP